MEAVLEDRELFTALRRKAGLTQGEAALAAGTHQSELSRWERGRGALPAGVTEALWALVRGGAAA